MLLTLLRLAQAISQPGLQRPSRTELTIYACTLLVLVVTVTYWFRRFRHVGKPDRSEISMMNSMWFASAVLAIISFLYASGVVYHPNAWSYTP